MTRPDGAGIGLRHLWRPPTNLLALGFGAGLSPWAPGTFGTLIAVPLYLLLAQLPLGWYVACVVVASTAGVWICERANTSLGREDHPGIVWDEVCGYLVAMIALPVQWPWVVAGFVLFRVLDIGKPWPVGWLEKSLPGGLGVMADDIAAGLMTLVTLHLAMWVLT